MYYVKRAIYGPDPKEQKRKCDALIRKNQREIDKQLSGLRASENKTKGMIKQCARRNDVKSARMLAREIFKAQKHREKLLESKARLSSIQMQVGEAFAMQKMQGSMTSSAQLMKEVNQLVQLPELMGTMQMLGQELIKSGVIDEMVTETLESLDEYDAIEDDAEGQVTSILDEILGEKKTTEPAVAAPAAPAAARAEPETEAEEDEAMISDFRKRLQALHT
ncbi:Vacuolar protein-sorting-associated protein 24 [Wickerhamiella sorbophila]|uniref:Vacuolar protein-sorting-associated protein 24 n=1 Tax=Wickerhamiella sorbophila TaxID=45607 RepID=A0A2T0FLW4_9ASCO|nr:Vacuolar protein-sorting-associated protein 24 [Wickerhamiella sorbophila]PRT55978.1 Vacuolar protein-sorting-associated protein 24 [Wickerhamiella sorbophila]